MILKASQRGGGQNLAAHLMRTDENEHVQVHDIRGFVADDLRGAFKEAYAISKGTKCRQYLFSMSLNPPPVEDVGIEVFEKAVERTESELGLENQPRVIVFHEKEGRRHAHVVWSRINAETMTAKQMSFFKTKLKDLSREIFLEQEWNMPRGLANPAQRDPRNFTLEEWQKAKRAGSDPRALKGAVQDAWAISDTRDGLRHALEERGYWLARGDRRAHVVVDMQGEVYSLARTLGKKTKDVNARLGEPETLLDVNEAKKQIAKTMTPVMKRHINHAREMHQKRQAVLDGQRSAMQAAHQEARRKVQREQKIRQEREAIERQKALPKGLKGLWARVTGNYAKVKTANEAHADQCRKRDLKERNTMVADQLCERRGIQRKIVLERQNHAMMLHELRRDVSRFRTLETPRNHAPRRERSAHFDRDR